MNNLYNQLFAKEYLIAFLLFLISFQEVWGQTTFTESAAAHGLNLGQNKDGGHAWSDFDNDGDLDVLVLENNNNAGVRSFLMQNNAGVFTNVQATLVPGMLGDRAERQAAWGDLNGDGKPDFLITSSGTNASFMAIQIFIQNPDGTFGNGIGGTAPITVGENASATITINPLNVEGAGFFDFEGDGDLDIFFDSHNYGIELLRNNYIDDITHTVVDPAPNALFTHITPGNGAGVVEFGLNQFATDGDYGSAADVNDDGWVDIFMRKRDENDFFLNQGGTFTNGSDLAQAQNSNKGGNGLWDLDNDGDLDAVWTENGLNQIFRNDGPGIWTALGAATFPGLPQPPNANSGSSSNDIDALAGGDIDNDGDIDILFVGDNRSYLFINQLNSPTPAPGQIGSGTAMTFTLDGETFNNRNGEGTTMIDIDDDGDLDIYMSINNNSGNQLWINNLPAANRVNHLIIDVTEDRGANGSTGGIPERVAIGANLLIRDCAGNIISGLRQVNGVYGHGTQSPESVHFGLPLGENETYIVEIRYPNFYDPVEGFKRLIGSIIATPSTIPGTNHYTINATEAEISENINAPDAVDDIETVALGNNISVQLSLFDNDHEADGDTFYIDSVVQPAVGSVVIDDANTGLVTYTYNAANNFPGTSFTYTITDAPVSVCPASGKSDTATVTIVEPCADPAGLDTDGDGINDVCDLDDDNDGILDCDEAQDSVNSFFAWNLNTSGAPLSMDGAGDSDITNWVLSATGDYTWNGLNLTFPFSSFRISNIADDSMGEAIANNNYIQTTFTTDVDLINPMLTNIHSGWFIPVGGDSYYLGLAISEDNFTTSELLSTDVFHTDPGGGANYTTFDLMDASSYLLKSNTTYTVRVYFYDVIDDSPDNYINFDDFTFFISACRADDSDTDTILNHLDPDSDNDGCSDADEAYVGLVVDADSDDNGLYGSGIPTVDNDGQVIAAAYNTTNSFFKDALVNGCDDNDNDGVADIVDLDDDNDGITDIEECQEVASAEFLVNSSLVRLAGNSFAEEPDDWQRVPFDFVHSTATSATTASVDLVDSNLLGTYQSTVIPSPDGGQFVASISGQIGPLNFDEGIQQAVTGLNSSEVYRLTYHLAAAQDGSLHSDDGFWRVYFNDELIATSAVIPNPGSGTAVWSTETVWFSPPASSGILRFLPGNDGSAAVRMFIDGISLKEAFCDTDLDGTINRLDNDSDDDGCSDVLEAYGTLTADSDNNGYYGTGNPPAVNADGTVVSATYITPVDNDSNGIQDFQEMGIAPTISSQPSAITLCPGCSGSLSVVASNSDMYQWQFFDGAVWVDLTNSGIYSGVDTNILSLTNVTPDENGLQYRVIISSSAFICSNDISNVAILTVNVPTVITNRRITYRVKKN